MNDTLPADPGARPEPPSAVTFRMFTPVFGHSIVGASSFTHNGEFGDARYTVSLSNQNPLYGPDTEEFLRGVGLDTARGQAVHISEHFIGDSTTHFLVTDLSVPGENVPATKQNSWQSERIHFAAINALQLHSPAGLKYDRTYALRRPPLPADSGRMPRGEPHARQVLARHTGAAPELRVTDFDACRKTIETLIHRPPNETSTLGKVQKLAMAYHRVSFTLEDPAHAFLLLMVVFEAMFKSEAEGNAGPAARRIGRFLGATPAECRTIQEQFFGNAPDAFCKIRNSIAHGDTNLAQATVRAAYPCLYRYITMATIRLLSLTSDPGPGHDIDTTLDYYDQIEGYVDRRFGAL